MTIEGMNHFTVLTDDVAKTVRFYGEVLGLVPGERPNFDFPGAWLYAEDRPILHIVGGRSRDALKAGVIDHIAFSARGLAATLARLTGRNAVALGGMNAPRYAKIASLGFIGWAGISAFRI